MSWVTKHSLILPTNFFRSAAFVAFVLTDKIEYPNPNDSHGRLRQTQCGNSCIDLKLISLAVSDPQSSIIAEPSLSRSTSLNFVFRSTSMKYILDDNGHFPRYIRARLAPSSSEVIELNSSTTICELFLAKQFLNMPKTKWIFIWIVFFLFRNFSVLLSRFH